MFEPYRETYRANNEHMTKAKEAYADSSLEEFRKTVDKYKGMTEDFEAIPARATVGPPNLLTNQEVFTYLRVCW